MVIANAFIYEILMNYVSKFMLLNWLSTLIIVLFLIWLIIIGQIGPKVSVFLYCMILFFINYSFFHLFNNLVGFLNIVGHSFVGILNLC
jgi:hypothetical protein